MDAKALDQCLYEIGMVEEESSEKETRAHILADSEEKLERVMAEIRELLYDNGCVLDGKITILDTRTDLRYGYEESKATQFRR